MHLEVGGKGNHALTTVFVVYHGTVHGGSVHVSTARTLCIFNMRDAPVFTAVASRCKSGMIIYEVHPACCACSG